ncbi:thioesterase [Chitinimonas prasina]|uniref:Thioesterase n=1 Tax=Chitinimonas prasina TaxID=1434937 RepID=A0ABQ5YG15_9NEIS|nr:thioesterase [Chitinimonas prasina]
MSHTLHKTVCTFHCDAYGHVNNARYLEFLDEARQNLTDLAWFGSQGIMVVVSRIDIRYVRPAKLGDTLAIETELIELGERQGVLQQLISRGGKTVAMADVTVACLSASSPRPLLLDGELRARFEAMRKG